MEINGGNKNNGCPNCQRSFAYLQIALTNQFCIIVLILGHIRGWW